MDQDLGTNPILEKLSLLGQCGPASLMGKLLRKFWHPVALSAQVERLKAVPIRVLGEDLTLYRGESGRAHLVGGRCAHRLTLLYTGWVAGEEIRCIYHGWQYDETGRCTMRPAEADAGQTQHRIVGYPVHEYGGLVFAYMGEPPIPTFDLPRKEAFERPGGITFARSEIWPCNWFQQIENSLDATHVSFVHQAGKVGTFGQAVSGAIPKLDYVETDAGIRQTATRSQNNVRVSDWTFPNNNHIVQPTLAKEDPWIDIGHWVVPVDDEHATRFVLYAVPPASNEVHARLTRYFRECGDYNPADHHKELFVQGKYPEDVFIQLTSAQDYVAVMGQGALVDRSQERLGKSDAGIALLRRIFWREIDEIRMGRPTKQWQRLAAATELPRQVAEQC
jgi:5,5'-dehydrodivanillate O-demethylase oxygenase subunit